ncbi:class I SAM-dependent methyltransferase [uncultured Paracoccus sp.]|uniref:class I SAM-dependent methyltransferase n=1 Tax=uncultured Paracoccus sp. TaxID=189685 RepID=UPI00261165AB|nr:class I SAM-dependent methyltransferase [uncultured Paracoccus sp.]
MSGADATDPGAHFLAGAEDYAAFRPGYPPDLTSALAGLAPDRALVVDVGCGSGQLTRALARHFDSVVGVDVSQAQLAAADPDPRIRYVQASSDALPVPDRSAALITAGQAAHWFDLPRFYDEVRRAARPGGVVALISYGPLRLKGPLADLFDRFYGTELRPFWPPERLHVDRGYRDLPFPFLELSLPPSSMDLAWPLDRLFGYVRSWSASKAAIAAGSADLIDRWEAGVRAILPVGAVVKARSELATRVGRIE